MTSIQKAKALRKQDYLKGNDSCLAKVKDDEPIFVLRASDVFAPLLVQQWASLAHSAGVPQDKIDGAVQIAKIMQKYPIKKIPD